MKDPALLAVKATSTAAATMLREVVADAEGKPDGRGKMMSALPPLLSLALAEGSVASTMSVATGLLSLGPDSTSPEALEMLSLLEANMATLETLHKADSALSWSQSKSKWVALEGPERALVPRECVNEDNIIVRSPVSARSGCKAFIEVVFDQRAAEGEQIQSQGQNEEAAPDPEAFGPNPNLNLVSSFTSTSCLNCNSKVIPNFDQP